MIGKDPIKLYGASWSLESNNAQNVHIETEVYKGSKHSFTIKMTLDKSHGYAPSYAEVQSNYWVMKCIVKKFRLYQGVWISTNVSTLETWFQDLNQTRDWTLQQVKVSKPTTLEFSKKAEVVDYRLLNKNPMPGDIVKANQKQDTNVVQYYWPGKLPNTDALTKLDQKQHPGEATPDYSQSSSAAARSNIISSALPFAGGVLCLVGGVWMFKKRQAK